MKRSTAAAIGLVILVVIFGTAMLMRIAARFFFALSYLLEALGVLAIAVVVGYVSYRVLAGDSNDPRTIEELLEEEPGDTIAEGAD